MGASVKCVLITLSLSPIFYDSKTGSISQKIILDLQMDFLLFFFTQPIAIFFLF